MTWTDTRADLLGFRWTTIPKMRHFKAQDDVSQIFQEKQPFGKDSKI